MQVSPNAPTHASRTRQFVFFIIAIVHSFLSALGITDCPLPNIRRNHPRRSRTGRRIPSRTSGSRCSAPAARILSLRDSYRDDLRAQIRHRLSGYVRFHAIFHDDVGVYDEDAHGNPVYNFSYVDQIYDGLLAEGVRPFVELSFMPAKLARNRRSLLLVQADRFPAEGLGQMGRSRCHILRATWLTATASTRSRNGTSRSGTSRISTSGPASRNKQTYYRLYDDDGQR